MRLPRLERLALLAVAVALTAAPSAYAEDASGVATELFNAGRDLMKAGDFKTACPKLAESARLDPKVGTLARLAECEEKIGHFVSARSRWEQAVNVALSNRDDRLTHVKSELARLDSVVPKLSMTLDGAPPPDLRIRIDDLEIGQGSLGVPLPVEAGTHHVSVSASGKRPWSTELVTQANGAVLAVRIPALADQAADVPVVVAPPRVTSAPRTLGPVRIGAIVTGSAGVVGLVVGGAFAAVAAHKNSESNQAPGGCNAESACPPAAYALRNDARSAGDLSTAFFIAGGALAAGGVVLWLAAPREHAVSVAPTALPQGAGLTFRGAF